MIWSVASSFGGSTPTAFTLDSPQDPASLGANNGQNSFGANFDPASMSSSQQSADGEPFVVPVDKPRGIFSKLFGVIKNGAYNIATKLGYIKKPPGSPADSPSASWSPIPGGFQCMMKADVPILVQNNPVWVSHPQELTCIGKLLNEKVPLIRYISLNTTIGFFPGKLYLKFNIIPSCFRNPFL